MTKKSLLVTVSTIFLFAVSLGNKASKMSEKCGLGRKIGFQNKFYTKCINVIIDSIDPSTILRSIYWGYIIQFSTNIIFLSLKIDFDFANSAEPD